MTTETKPTAPAPHLKCVSVKCLETYDVFLFDDGSAWIRRDWSWQCVWQPTTHLVAVDRKALDTLLEVARDLQKQIIAGRDPASLDYCIVKSLDFAIDAAKEALGVLEI